jgi:hypothetical protein
VYETTGCYLDGCMLKPRIDKSTLPEHLLGLKRVSDMEEWLQECLLLPGRVEKIYVHEGAHLYYFRQIHPCSKFIPPSIYYYEETGVYEPVSSMIDTRGIGKECDYNRLLTFAKAVFSGGLVEGNNQLQKDIPVEKVVEELGDAKDISNFGLLCDEIRNASPDLPPFENRKVRIDALISVVLDVCDAKSMASIDSTIQEVKTAMFASMYPDGSSTIS